MKLSVVIPVFNARSHIASTVDSAITAIERSSRGAEIVLVDDGSTDDSAAVAKQTVDGRLPLQVLRQSNQGRFEARRAGVEAATGDWILLLDSRLTLAPDALRFVTHRAETGELVWTGHVDILVDRNRYAAFWNLIAELAWDEYFSEPRTVSFGLKNFDRFPKGTGCFFAPRPLLIDAVGAFRSRYADTRYANDDTPLIRWIAERERIHISPEFSGAYVARADLRSFVRHSFHRGIVFLDGHGRPESRFSGVVFGFYPVSVLVGFAAIRKPLLVPVAGSVLAAAAAAFGVRRGRSSFEVESLAALAPVYAVAHGAGMWGGLALIARDQLRRRRRP